MTARRKGKTPTPTKRLDREAWLTKALEVLSGGGEGQLRINRVCEALGVTKGSFYWHFKTRRDFLQAMLVYWSDRFTKRVPEVAAEHGGSADDRLRCVFELVTREDLGKYDIAIDAWAAHEPWIAPQVRKAYRYRYNYVSSLFRELGFSGVALETRTVAFLSFLKVESKVIGKKAPKRSARRITSELEFFTRPA